MTDRPPLRRYLDLRPSASDYPLRAEPSPEPRERPLDLSAYRAIDSYATPRSFRYRPLSDYDRTVDGAPADLALLPPHLRMLLWPSDRRGRR